jgi:S-DNA-T family DNA segregation ATPase FtsK/SpoIIIE
MPLSAGNDIRPIRAATEDLEREVGVAPITVENDPARAGHVRFLVARPDRIYPSLPSPGALPSFVPSSGDEYGALVVGETLEGAPLVSCVSEWPHMLVGGGSSSGKTTLLKTLLHQSSLWGPEYCRIALADGKQGIDFFGVVPPECFAPEFPDVLMGTDPIADLLRWLAEEEIPRRSGIIRQLAVDEGSPRDAKRRLLGAVEDREVPPFPVMLVVVDEFAEIMAGGGRDAQTFEAHVRSIAQVGRAALVHLVLATQRPDATIVKGAIKANLDARIALSLPSQYDSKTILDGGGAERLLGRGDMIFKTNSGTWRLQGYQVAPQPPA